MKSRNTSKATIHRIIPTSSSPTEDCYSSELQNIRRKILLTASKSEIMIHLWRHLFLLISKCLTPFKRRYCGVVRDAIWKYKMARDYDAKMAQSVVCLVATRHLNPSGRRFLRLFSCLFPTVEIHCKMILKKFKLTLTCKNIHVNESVVWKFASEIRYFDLMKC